MPNTYTILPFSKVYFQGLGFVIITLKIFSSLGSNGIIEFWRILNLKQNKKRTIVISYRIPK